MEQLADSGAIVLALAEGYVEVKSLGGVRQLAFAVRDASGRSVHARMSKGGSTSRPPRRIYRGHDVLTGEGGGGDEGIGVKIRDGREQRRLGR